MLSWAKQILKYSTHSIESDDSADSEDLANELDEFFRFIIWNDLSEEEDKNQVLLKMRSWEALSALDDFDDDSGDDGYLPQASDNRERFSPSAQEVFPCKSDQKLSEDDCS